MSSLERAEAALAELGNPPAPPHDASLDELTRGAAELIERRQHLIDTLTSLEPQLRERLKARPNARGSLAAALAASDDWARAIARAREAAAGRVASLRRMRQRGYR